MDWIGYITLVVLLVLAYLLYDAKKRFLNGRKKAINVDVVKDVNTYNKDELIKLNKSLNLFKKLEEVRGVGVWSWDVICDHIEISNGFNEIWDIDEFERIPVATFMDCVHTKDRERVSAVLQKALETGKGYEVQFTIIRRDKKEVEVKVCAKSYHDNNNVFNNLSGSIEKV